MIDIYEEYLCQVHAPKKEIMKNAIKQSLAVAMGFVGGAIFICAMQRFGYYQNVPWKHLWYFWFFFTMATFASTLLKKISNKKTKNNGPDYV